MQTALVIVLVLLLLAGGIAFAIGNWRERVVARALTAYAPDTPLQILEKRLASGEISDEQYQYERYLLEKEKS